MEIDNNFGYEKITQLVDNIPLIVFEGLQGFLPIGRCHLHKAIKICSYIYIHNIFNIL